MKVNCAETKGMSEDTASTGRVTDWAAKPRSFMAGWGVPMIVLIGTNFVPMPSWLVTIIIAATLTWMGIGCVMNARRCHRRHCYYSGPVLLIGAAVSLLVGFGLLDFGPDGLTMTVWSTMISVLLTFIPELTFGEYRKIEE